MLITAVEPILIAVPYDHGAPKPTRSTGPWERMEALFVRIDTDSGITGWGEAFGFSISHVTHTAIAQVLAPLCVGRDPEPLPELMASLRRSTLNFGTSGPVRYALSGIELALWDIAGKIRDEPLHALLGGKKRSRISTYASFLPYRDVALVERHVDRCMQLGYTHAKLHERSVEPVAAARRIAGDAMTLALDTNCAWSLDEATDMAQRLEPFDLKWLEEPIYPADDFAALAALRAATAIPIAFGENVGSVGEARRAFAAGACDIIQPDAIKIGGVAEMLETIGAARAAGVQTFPHSPFFGPALIATLHAIATLDEPIMCERFYCDLEAYVAGAAVTVVDGMLSVPDGPGLGLTLDLELMAHYRIA